MKLDDSPNPRNKKNKKNSSRKKTLPDDNLDEFQFLENFSEFNCTFILHWS